MPFQFLGRSRRAWLGHSSPDRERPETPPSPAPKSTASKTQEKESRVENASGSAPSTSQEANNKSAPKGKEKNANKVSSGKETGDSNGPLNGLTAKDKSDLPPRKPNGRFSARATSPDRPRRPVPPKIIARAEDEQAEKPREPLVKDTIVVDLSILEPQSPGPAKSPKKKAKKTASKKSRPSTPNPSIKDNGKDKASKSPVKSSADDQNSKRDGHGQAKTPARVESPKKTGDGTTGSNGPANASPSASQMDGPAYSTRKRAFSQMNEEVHDEASPTDPVTTEPATTEPATLEPVTSQPSTSQPATTEPLTLESLTLEPSTTDPVTTETTTAEAATIETVTLEPVTLQPAASQPATTEPATFEPVISQSATSQPEHEATTKLPDMDIDARSENDDLDSLFDSDTPLEAEARRIQEAEEQQALEDDAERARQDEFRRTFGEESRLAVEAPRRYQAMSNSQEHQDQEGPSHVPDMHEESHVPDTRKESPVADTREESPAAKRRRTENGHVPVDNDGNPNDDGNGDPRGPDVMCEKGQGILKYVTFEEEVNYDDGPPVLIGVWSPDEPWKREPTRGNCNAVYGYVSYRDNGFRVRIVLENPSGRRRFHTFPNDFHNARVPFSEIRLEPGLIGEPTIVIKHYCDIRQTQVEGGEGPEDQEINKCVAISEGKRRVYGQGHEAVVRPSPGASTGQPSARSQDEPPTSSNRPSAVVAPEVVHPMYRPTPYPAPLVQAQEPPAPRMPSPRMPSPRMPSHQVLQPQSSPSAASVASASSAASAPSVASTPEPAPERRVRKAPPQPLDLELSRPTPPTPDPASETTADSNPVVWTRGSRDEASIFGKLTAAQRKLNKFFANAIAEEHEEILSWYHEEVAKIHGEFLGAAGAAGAAAPATAEGTNTSPSPLPSVPAGEADGDAEREHPHGDRARSASVLRLTDTHSRVHEQEPAAHRVARREVTHDGVKFAQKVNGPFFDALTAQGTLVTIDGEDFVEYRVLTKPRLY